MKLEAKRIFISDLPETATDEEIQEKFGKFGNVTAVEIKERKTLGARNTSLFFAFVNLDITSSSLQKCFDEFSNKQWKGEYVNVQLAKDSFLEKLKKEREEAQKKHASKPTEIQPINGVATNKTFPESKTNGNFTKSKSIQSKINDYHSSSSSSSSDEESEKPPLAKKSKESTEEPIKETNVDYSEIVVKDNRLKSKNGKLQIESVGNAPIIVSGIKKKKSKDPYREQADKKRIKSMLELKKSHQHQKSLIRKALIGLDSAKNNKIVFDESDEETTKTQETPSKSALFEEEEEGAEDGDNEENYDFSNKKQFDGKKGEKLFQLQSRFNADKRFHLDERFAESDNENEDANDENNTDEVEENSELLEESRKNLEILSEVIGKKIVPKSAKKEKQMLRFDPNQPEHSKFELKPEEPKPKKRKMEKKETQDTEKLPEVSHETFFEVAEDLKDALKEKESFSFLQMFGPREAKSTEETEDKSKTDEKPSKTFGKRFRYDSSTDDEAEDSKSKQIADEIKEEPKSSQRLVNLGPQRLWTESFFFKADDYRFQEGLQFFARSKSKESDEDFKDVRHRIKQIVKSKVKNNQQKRQKFKKKVAIKRKISKSKKLKSR